MKTTLSIIIFFTPFFKLSAEVCETKKKDLSTALSNNVKTEELKSFTKDENVPPEGVLSTSPKNCNDIIEPGSTLILQSDYDTTYVMGVNIGYAK